MAVLTGGIQAETWQCDLQTGQSGLQDICLCRSDGETHVRLKSNFVSWDVVLFFNESLKHVFPASGSQNDGTNSCL